MLVAAGLTATVTWLDHSSSRTSAGVRPATVNVTIKAAGPAGAAVSGTLYLDALQSGVPPYGQLAGDEVAALPYSYVAG